MVNEHDKHTIICGPFHQVLDTYGLVSQLK